MNGSKARRQQQVNLNFQRANKLPTLCEDQETIISEDTRLINFWEARLTGWIIMMRNANRGHMKLNSAEDKARYFLKSWLRCQFESTLMNDLCFLFFWEGVHLKSLHSTSTSRSTCFRDTVSSLRTYVIQHKINQYDRSLNKGGVIWVLKYDIVEASWHNIVDRSFNCSHHLHCRPSSDQLRSPRKSHLRSYGGKRLQPERRGQLCLQPGLWNGGARTCSVPGQPPVEPPAPNV